MAYEQRDNSGTVFENDRKETDKHPDYTGKAMVGGVMYWASMWVKEKQDGTEFFSFSLKPMDDQQRQPQRQEPRYQEPQRQSRRVPAQGEPQQRQHAQQSRRAPSSFDDMDDDIPFISASPTFDMTPSKARRMARYDY